MQQKNKAIVLHKHGEKPVVEGIHLPPLSEGELLVKVEATTVNPSDRLLLEGVTQEPLPAIGGREATGVVVEAKGEELQSWVGKRVSFFSMKGGCWAEYSIASVDFTFEIEKDVPLEYAASGVTNPLTVIAMIENFKELGGKGGIIHTAAASALGRQLNKLAQKEGIPLLNIVRREAQAELLRKEGATHVIVTEGDWQAKLKEIVEKEDFNTVYDALGGGQVTLGIISSLKPKSRYYLYGVLESQTFSIPVLLLQFSRINLSGFILTNWWLETSEETRQRVRKEYSSLLKSVLTTNKTQEFTFATIDEAIEVSVSKATEGKVLVRPE